MPLQSYRPRSASELVDAALQLFRRHYTPLVALMAIGYLPVMIVLLVFRDELGMTPVMQNPTAPPSQIFAQMGPLFAIWLVLMLYFYIVMGALTVAASDVYLDERMDVGKSFRIA